MAKADTVLHLPVEQVIVSANLTGHLTVNVSESQCLKARQEVTTNQIRRAELLKIAAVMPKPYLRSSRMQRNLHIRVEL